jgi:apolipoprotein N-acyltransferase
MGTDVPSRRLTWRGWATTCGTCRIAYGPDGTILDRYEKEHQVPFGEYIPARRLLSRLTDATALVPKDAIVGPGHRPASPAAEDRSAS